MLSQKMHFISSTKQWTFVVFMTVTVLTFWIRYVLCISSPATVLCFYLINCHTYSMLHIFSKMLHSILFLGNIHSSRYPPDVIFANEAMYEAMYEVFQGPFNRYRQDVPQRTPFSYFLELVSDVPRNLQTAVIKTD